jgi:hypothetical protein
LSCSGYEPFIASQPGAQFGFNTGWNSIARKIPSLFFEYLHLDEEISVAPLSMFSVYRYYRMQLR